MRSIAIPGIAASLVLAVWPQGPFRPQNPKRIPRGIVQVVPGPPAPMVRVSVGGVGEDSNGESKHPSISAEGRFVVFESDATNLGPADTNNRRDVYLRDRDPDNDGFFDEPNEVVTFIMSVSRSGQQGDGNSFDPTVSSNGRHVVFTSDATTLGPGDTNTLRDIYVHDRDPDNNGIFDEPFRVSTWLVSTSAEGVAQGDGQSGLARISADGRHIVFQSLSTNLVLNDSNLVSDVFIHDRDPDQNGVYDEGNNTTVLASINLQGVSGNGSSSQVSISFSGRYVVFESNADDLVDNDVNLTNDIFVHDRDPDGNGIFDEGNQKLARVSVRAGGVGGNGQSRRPHVSENGRFVVFESDATNLGPVDTNGQRDIYVVDRDPDLDGILAEGNDVVTILSVSNQGVQANLACIHGRISGDGRFVAYVSFSDVLVPGDNNNTFDVFLRDRDPDQNGIYDEGNGITSILSANAAGDEGDELSGNGEISQDGRFKAFVSDATNLVPAGDQNALRDIYVRRIH